MLQRLFAALENCPPHSQPPLEFNYIFGILWRASRKFKTPLSLRVARDVIVQGIPTVLRKTKSISLALALAQGAAKWNWHRFNLGERPYVTVDKIMLDLWSEKEGVEGCTKENLEKWKEFRSDSLRWYEVDLADLNGPLPVWSPRAAHAGPSRLDGFLSVLGIHRVRVLCISMHLAAHSYQPCRMRRAMKIPLNHDHIRYLIHGALLSCRCSRSWSKPTMELRVRRTKRCGT